MRKIVIILVMLLMSGCSNQNVGGGEIVEKKQIIPIDKLNTENGEISINNQDNNINETFIIKSDLERYYGDNGNVDIILAVTNLKEDEYGYINLKYSKGEKINSISTYDNIKEITTVPEYEKIEVDCEYISTTTCYENVFVKMVEKEIIIDKWTPIELINKETRYNILKKISVGEYDKKEGKILFKEGTTFLKINVSHPLKVMDKFYVEVFGENGGYGLLDPIITDLVSYYSMDESSDGSGAVTRVDSEGSNDLTDVSNAPSGTGKISNGIDLNGTNEYLHKASGFDTITGDFTISLWVEPDVYATKEEYLVNFGYNNSNSLLFVYYNVSGTYYIHTLIVTGGSLTVYRTDDVLTGNEWNFLAIVRDGTVLYTYLNGALVHTHTNVSTVSFDSGVLDIGWATPRNKAGTYFNGIIDEVGIWDRALDSDEISDLYNSGDGFAYPFTEDTSDPCTPTAGQPFFQSQDCYLTTDVYHNDKWIDNGHKLIYKGGRLILE